jgi:hypothetical protein
MRRHQPTRREALILADMCVIAAVIVLLLMAAWSGYVPKQW